MTGDEILDDLDDRISRGVAVLSDLVDHAAAESDERALEYYMAKRAGLQVVKDWLRSYRGAA